MGKSGFGCGILLVGDCFQCRLRGPRGFSWEKVPAAGFGAGGGAQGNKQLDMLSIWGAGRFSGYCRMSRSCG